MPEAGTDYSTHDPWKAKTMKKMQRKIRVTGADAIEFLQGQLTNDLSTLQLGDSQLSAWCTPKGRVIALFNVQSDADGLALSAPDALVESLISRMTMYRFRANVVFETEKDATSIDLASRIADGIPWIGLQQTEKFTPHMLNLDLLRAISLDKGCYTGQEIVARTHYKGATKRRMLRFSAVGEVAVGDKISDGSRDIGDVLNVANNDFLAVIPVAKIATALFVGEQPIALGALPYQDAVSAP